MSNKFVTYNMLTCRIRANSELFMMLHEEYNCMPKNGGAIYAVASPPIDALQHRNHLRTKKLTKKHHTKEKTNETNTEKQTRT